MPTKIKKCHYCGKETLYAGPYGPGGAFVCWPCAFDSDEHMRIAERQIRKINRKLRPYLPR